MPTQLEEQQAKEFLSRAEIRTMKKDLKALREADAVKERDKIVKIRTIEEQIEDKKKTAAVLPPVPIAPRRKPIKNKVVIRQEDPKPTQNNQKDELEENILLENEREQKIAEKDLKNYATEGERQQIFILESERLNFEKQIDQIDKEKDPDLKLQKNELLIQKRGQQVKLDDIIKQEERLQGEEKVFMEKGQSAASPQERKSLEQAKWDVEKKIQEVEKKRWVIEGKIKETDEAVANLDAMSDQNAKTKNDLREKLLGVDKSLRDIYSGVIIREEQKRKGEAAEQVARKEALATMKAEKNERVQRQQWRSAPNEELKRQEFIKKVEELSAQDQPASNEAQPAIPVPKKNN